MTHVEAENAVNRERQKIREMILTKYQPVLCRYARTCPSCSRGFAHECANTRFARGNNFALSEVLSMLK